MARVKKVELTAEHIRDYWLQKWHGIDTKWLIDNEPELIKTPDWYKKYAVTKEQHDEWYDWAITTIAKDRRCSKKMARRLFVWDYLNLSPTVSDEFKPNSDEAK